MSCGVKGGSTSIGGGGSICVGGGGFSGGSGKGIKITSSGSSRGFSRKSYGGGPCRSIGGGFSSGSCGRISRGRVCYGGSSYGGGSYGGGMYGGGVYGGGGYGEGGCYPFSSGSLVFGGGDGGLLSTNEKTTMQVLNERLSQYLDRVRCLEDENAQLDISIREWYQKHGGTTELRDYNPYYQQIDQLYNELVCETDEYNKYLLNIDNTRMTAEDFKLKYQTECGLRQNVEADINGLRPLLDQLTLARSDLEMQYESLKEELICLKKNHEETMRGLICQSGHGDVSVEVNATPGINLKQRLDDLRAEYEQLIEQNRREVESWYECKMEEVRQEVNTSGQEITSVNHQVTELRREYQNLEIELQSQLSMIQSLQSNLEDTERRYNMQLQQIQCMIEPVEAELVSIRDEIQKQIQEYQLLLGIKTRLEQEICQYRRLLEEGQQEIGSAGYGIGYSGGRRGSIGRISTGGGIIGGGGGSCGRIGGGGGSCGVIGGGGGSIGVGTIGGGGSCTDIGGGGSQVCGGGISTSSPCYPQPVQPCKTGYGRKSCD